ncbi:MAG: hypothetical protein K2X34_12205 [Hyphomonadaceae bacterium]|nr:hypothetical protein [Hyphomonadaceae bacterium]
MRSLLGGLAAAFAFFFIAAAPAAAETINCPLSEARRTITTPLPSGWWTTPIVDDLSETRVQDIGGTPALVCVYGPAGSVQREAPANHDCTARTGGFECVPRIRLVPGLRPVPGLTPITPSASVVHAQGTGVVRQTYMFDLDTGAETGAGADLWFHAVSNTELYLEPRNGARLALGDGSDRGHSGCSSATLTTARIPLASLAAGTFVCARTSDGRVAQFRIDGVAGSPRYMTLTFTTWQ